MNPLLDHIKQEHLNVGLLALHWVLDKGISQNLKLYRLIEKTKCQLIHILWY